MFFSLLFLPSACISTTITSTFQPLTKEASDFIFFFASTPLNYLSPHKSSIFLLGLKESFPTIFKHLHFVPLLLAAGSKPNTSRAWAPMVGSSCLEFRQHYTKASTTSYTLKKSVPEDLSWSCYAGTSTQYMQT